MKKLLSISTIILFFVIFSCRKETPIQPCLNTTKSAQESVIQSLRASLFLETFETGTKTAYTTADVTLSSGIWNLNDALIGNSTSDIKNGLQSARVRNSGILSMKFDYTGGASIVSIKHAKYGSDANGTWQLWYSVNTGSTYVQAGATITSSSTTLTNTSFTLNVAGNIRFQIRKTDGGTNRINFDDISINGYTSNNPVPTLSTISPTSATSGSAQFTLTVNGTNFINGSVINWNGVALATTFVSNIKLTTTIPAANISTTGTSAITVTNAAPGGGTSSSSIFTVTAATTTAKKFLFDATKAETAGNADWVIDEDSSPQNIPTPTQSNITSTTTETYWTGALSSWGISLVKSGNSVETLPAGTAITYGTTGAKDLSKYDVFVIDEPNTRFTAAEKTAILNFVKNGGGLFMISDHTISDRNNDGWDSPAIWNDLMTNNTVQNNPFGFSIDLTNISETSTNVLLNSANPIMNGSQGSVSQLQFNNGATLTLQPSVNTTVQGLIWRSSSTQSTNNVMCASSSFGSGRVFVVTDSSPMDDGTGASGNTLYVSWPLYSHSKLFMNASLWLAKLQ